MTQNKCKKCKYSWESRIEYPKSCPKCKRYDWDIGFIKFKCSDCGNIIASIIKPIHCFCGNKELKEVK